MPRRYHSRSRSRSTSRSRSRSRDAVVRHRHRPRSPSRSSSSHVKRESTASPVQNNDRRKKARHEERDESKSDNEEEEEDGESTASPYHFLHQPEPPEEEEERRLPNPPRRPDPPPARVVAAAPAARPGAGAPPPPPPALPRPPAAPAPVPAPAPNEEGDPEEGPGEVSYEIEAMREVEFDTYVETETVYLPNWCYLCHYSQCPAETTANERHSDLLKYWRENKNFVHPHTFVRNVQKKYTDTLRPCLKKLNGVGYTYGPYWSARSIWEHEELHAPRPESIRENLLRVYTAAINTMRDNGVFIRKWTTFPSGRKVQGPRDIDPNKLKLLMQVGKTAESLSTQIAKARGEQSSLNNL